MNVSALTLLGASLPVFLVASAWACVGTHQGGCTSAPAAPETDPELDAIERELREEMALRDRTAARGTSRTRVDDGG